MPAQESCSFPSSSANVPKTDLREVKGRYETLARANEYIHSAQYVHRGGVAAALKNSACAGDLGMVVDLDGSDELDAHTALFSETTGRFIVTVHPSQQRNFEEAMGSCYVKKIGNVVHDDEVIMDYNGERVIHTNLETLRGQNAA